jgi:hypothetical protein
MYETGDRLEPAGGVIDEGAGAARRRGGVRPADISQLAGGEVEVAAIGQAVGIGGGVDGALVVGHRRLAPLVGKAGADVVIAVKRSARIRRTGRCAGGAAGILSRIEIAKLNNVEPKAYLRASNRYAGGNTNSLIWVASAIAEAAGEKIDGSAAATRAPSQAERAKVGYAPFTARDQHQSTL